MKQSAHCEPVIHLRVIWPSNLCLRVVCPADHIDNLKISRDEFMEKLFKENIGTGVHYISLHLHPYYKETFGFKQSDFPNSSYISERTVSIPFSAKLTDQDVEDVVEGVTKILNYYKK